MRHTPPPPGHPARPLPDDPPIPFTRAEALRRRESDRTLRAALRSGLIVRIRHGAYARTQEVGGLDERARHLVLARAALAQIQGLAALDGPSAALLRGFDVWGHDLSLVHVMRLDAGSGRREAGVVHHVYDSEAASRVEVVAGLLCVSAEDAVWQVARLSGLEGGVVTADSALHQRPALSERLRGLASANQRQPGSRTARLAVRLAHHQAESVGESLTRVACFRHGIPCPTLQHGVHDLEGRLLGTSDFYWEEARLLGEFDGKIKYGRLLKDDQSATDVVVAEKRREDSMRSTERGMARFAWFEVQPDVAGRRMARLRQELAQSKRLYVRVGA